MSALLRAHSMLGNHIRKLSTTSIRYDPLKVAVIGQSMFGAEVYKKIKQNGHEVVGVFTVPDLNGKPDPLALAAEEGGTPVFKYSRWRNKGKVIDSVLDEFKSVKADLNVLPFCTQFIPMEVINMPKYQSIVYHPSILPLHRGASAINWTLINGDRKAGFTIFWADDGLDTGPILLQKECEVEPNDTVDVLYNRFLYPEGIRSLVEAVNLVSAGKAPRIAQQEEGATYDAMLKKDKVQINWNQPARVIHNFIRGNDKVPGAWTKIDGEMVTLYSSQMWYHSLPRGKEVKIDDLENGRALVHDEGLLIKGNDGRYLNVTQLKFESSGKMIKAHKYGTDEDDSVDLGELSEDDLKIKESLQEIWENILAQQVTEETDYFKAGASSMDVVRLVEAIKYKLSISILNEDVFMATTFGEFWKKVVLTSRGVEEEKITYTPVYARANDMDLYFPNQLFINNKFVDSESGKTFKAINPANEEVICEVSLGNAKDVDNAVYAAKVAFERGEWGKMNARDRGTLLHKLADLMEKHQDELATLESLDSGAVYTLAIKTHIGMSIATFRYFAGWCDKIEGSVIPINNARPNKNLSFTRRQPIGVCAIITPWNYPLMMLAWKAASCLAAGNTLVLKPAQVTSLTSLKFCELVAKAGFPPGVVNVITGSGSVVGQAMADHPDIRKLGFTGSTPIGKTIMRSCADSNLKKIGLELGGKSPLIIFDDCDIDKAVKLGCSAVFFNKGENCIAAGRLFVHESIHDEYLDKVLEEIGRMKIGDPFDRNTDHGPQNHLAHLTKLEEYCKIGVEEGATLVAGGKRLDRPGLYMAPTVFTNVEDHMFISKEESFGPIMIISKFRDLEEVVARGNNTEFGLAAGVFTKDISKAMRVAEAVEAGTVFVNTYNKTDVAAPFGGFKQSGFGKDLGAEALNEYLKTKTVTLEY